MFCYPKRGDPKIRKEDTVRCVKCCVVLMYTLETLNVLSVFSLIVHICVALNVRLMKFTAAARSTAKTLNPKDGGHS